MSASFKAERGIFMNRGKRFRKPAVLLLLAAALTAAVFAQLPAVPARASEEEAAASYTLPETTLKEHSSYTTESYFGVRNLAVADQSVAYASIDSKSRVVITAVGSGSTTVTYWYRATANGGWISQTVPIRVSGKSDTSASLNLSSAGIVFPVESVTMTKGRTYSMTNLKLNGDAADAAKLLWVSSDDSVVTVGQKTGVLTAAAAGTATLFAIDPFTRACAGITVTVS